ncbi:hypothetical protein D915_006746 [Fasciola hepatica]|uniref:F-box domain-containing protein n=1 Tax=Fasciola hepatica TaxID=6192 RepID=A0A4E0RN59_FASHE|nr:hypothetical protein D915_006746 [Fasciola hepatica]
MDLPEFLLEEVFAYLGWSDRARAARVCRKWLSVFQAPSLWRRMVLKPPTRSLTRLQYDMKGYYMSCCLRKIGWYVREYRFIQSEDIFLLNRTLSLVAKFLETNPSKPSVAERPIRENCFRSVLSGSLDDELPQSPSPSDSSDEAISGQNQSLMGIVEDDDGDVQDAPDADEQRMSSYLGIVSGDPDAEATLKLILKLQKREMFGVSSQSSSSTDESDEGFLASLRTRSTAMSVSVPHSAWPLPPSGSIQSKTARLQRSQSCRYPRYQHVTRHPPTVRTFVLDFHCEVDETRGLVYGTGGALLTTIRRVLRQLIHLRSLRLTDLFLTTTDARNLLLDVAKTCSSTLLNLNLVHLYKPATDFADLVAPSSGPIHPNNFGRPEATSHGLDDDWYLLDSRWLGARPRRLHHNPMADLANLFPCLVRLSLGITQLTGPMLMRLLYQTSLSELQLVETDFSPFTLNIASGSSGVVRMGFPSRRSVAAADDLEALGSFELHPKDEPDDDLIDWGEDVPRYRDRVDSARLSLAITGGWEPIQAKVWTAALTLRPQFRVYFHSLFTRDRFDSLAGLDQFLLLWPTGSSPIRAFVFRTTHGIGFSRIYLSLSNPITITTYSSTLTTLVLWIGTESNVDSEDPKVGGNVATDRDGLNEYLLETLALCPRLSFIAFGGSCAFLSLLTLLTLCRQLARRLFMEDNPTGAKSFTLLIQRDCCQMIETQAFREPATVQAWYSTVLEAGKDPDQRALAAERCISAALNQPRWHFLSAGEFESHVSEFFA